MPINTDLIGYETKRVETLILEEKVKEYLSAINSTNNYYSLNEEKYFFLRYLKYFLEDPHQENLFLPQQMTKFSIIFLSTH